MTRQCKTCDFFEGCEIKIIEEGKTIEIGYCRAAPPRAQIIPEVDEAGVTRKVFYWPWPRVRSFDWCGLWRSSEMPFDGWSDQDEDRDVF